MEALLDNPMAKQARKDVTVKMDADVVAEAKMVAASMDITLAEYLSERIRPLVKADLASEYARRNPQGDKPAPKGKGAK